MGFAEAQFMESLPSAGFGRFGKIGLDELAMLRPALYWARRGGDEPFFLTLLTITTHYPYADPTGQISDPWQRYLAAVRRQDQFLGLLIQGLALQPGLENTIVIVVADHGQAFGERQLLQHNAVPYETVTRVPWLLFGPERFLGPPRRIGGVRHHYDLLPTLLELGGLELESGAIPGRSLLSTPGHDEVFSNCYYPNTCASLRRGPFKFIYHYGRQPTQVFDIPNDPKEERDIAATLPFETIRAAEERMLAFQGGVEAFWEKNPPADLIADWWRRAPAPSRPATEPTR
jgi:arylsulfatase A-like enzyme